MADSNIDGLLLRQLKAAMGYRMPTHCCKNCTKFVPTDCSGDLQAKHAHCTLNPAVAIPVEEQGSCNFIDLKRQ